VQGSAASAQYAAVVAPGDGAFRVGIRVGNGGVTRIRLFPQADPVTTRNDDPALVDRIVTQLNEYLNDPGKGFSLPLNLQGSVFQRRVWRALMDIPPGETRTYGMLARNMGTSARAIGGACRSNPVPIIVPCHRVVAAHGLGGYAGHTGGALLAIKNWLLEHESRLSCHLH